MDEDLEFYRGKKCPEALIDCYDPAGEYYKHFREYTERYDDIDFLVEATKYRRECKGRDEEQNCEHGIIAFAFFFSCF